MLEGGVKEAPAFLIKGGIGSIKQMLMFIILEINDVKQTCLLRIF